MSLVLSTILLVAQEEPHDVAEEGRNIIIMMLLVGLIFLSVIALGQLSRYMTGRRRARRAERTRVY